MSTGDPLHDPHDGAQFTGTDGSGPTLTIGQSASGKAIARAAKTAMVESPDLTVVHKFEIGNSLCGWLSTTTFLAFLAAVLTIFFA